MSRLARRTKTQNCDCAHADECGIIAAEIVGSPSCLTEKVPKAQLARRAAIAQHYQRTVIPHLYETPCRSHQGAYHAHPPHLSDVGDLIEPMAEHNLTMRVTHLNHGIDEQANCAEVTGEHLKHLKATGRVSVRAPASGGTFHLSANSNGNITDMQYSPA